MGYVPTDGEILEGLPDPYQDDSVGLRFSLPHADEPNEPKKFNLCLHVALCASLPRSDDLDTLALMPLG